MLSNVLIQLLLAVQSSSSGPLRPAPFPAPPPVRPPAPPASSETPEQVERPYPVLMPDPSGFYPAAAREAGRQGVTRLRCILTQEGMLTECAVHQSAGAADLDAAAFQVAAQARYSPMRVSGQAVKASVILPVRWVLAD